ncbi:MAG: hypothetical protein E7215_04250 [Clostridium sulfidigenes]|uniref:protein-tyrosine-phosphatase n=1 Tax=Clostridium sulfidigenes TaxID=318464 RepID=A0A927ZJL9_9CLOT|nr:hypothetical protein [Clostridium sulfidigenes]
MFASLIIKDLVINNKFNLMNVLEKIEAIKTLGVNRLIIAPFYYDEESKSSIAEVNAIVDDLNLYFTEKGLDLKLYAANIIRDNFDNIKEFVDGRIGSINNSKFVLLNIEESNTIKELIEIIYEFNLRDYVPIIFGPEKITEVEDNSKNIYKLLNENCLLQLDVASINGEYGKKTLKTAKELIKKDIYNFIGFEDKIDKGINDKDIQSISKKGLFILTKNGEVAKRKNTKNFKKGLFK